MAVRNFFTKAVAEHTACYSFFTGSVLGVEAHFRGCFAGNFFYLQIDVDGLWAKPFIRVKCFPTNSGLILLEVGVYSYDSGLYESLPFNDKDMAFLRHVASTCSRVLNKAAMQSRNKIEKMEFDEFEEIPF